MTWIEACHDKSLETCRIKLNSTGRAKSLSPTRNKHRFFQAEIGHLLRMLLPNGHVLVECAIDTPEGTYVADVAWATNERFKIIEDEFSCSVAPEICVEVWSQSNSSEEIEMKKRLYFDKGALEFWYCDQDGGMTFLKRGGQLPKSELCSKFPKKVEP